MIRLASALKHFAARLYNTALWCEGRARAVAQGPSWPVR